jgi:phosphatidylglycerol:prolipoprotein diacylglycerol transferase
MYPILAELGSIPIYSYGVMLGTSMIVAWYVVMFLGTRKEGLAREQMANAFIVTAIVAIVCARLLYVVTNPSEFDNPIKLIDLRSGGLVAYGGFLGGLLGAWLYWRKKNVPLLAWADVVAPTLGLGLGFTRIGCYLFGCDFGARLEEGAPEWLVKAGTFPGAGGGLNGEGSPAFQHHVQHYGLDRAAEHSFAVHPTQIYESLVGFFLFGITMLVWSRRRFRGQVVLTLTFLYGIWRFFIEYVRDDPERGGLFGFSTSQLISLALIPIAAFFYFQLRKAQGDAQLTPAVVPAEAKVVATKGEPSAEKPEKKRPKKKKKSA